MILSRRKYKPKKTRLGSYFKISKKDRIFILTVLIQDILPLVGHNGDGEGLAKTGGELSSCTVR